MDFNNLPISDISTAVRVVKFLNGSYFLMGKELSIEAYESFVEQTEQLVEDKLAMVMLGASPTNKSYNHIALTNVCGLVTEIQTKDDGLYLIINPVDGRQGDVLKKLLDAEIEGFIIEVRGYVELVPKSGFVRFIRGFNKNAFPKAEVFVKEKIEVFGFDLAPPTGYDKQEATDKMAFSKN